MTTAAGYPQPTARRADAVGARIVVDSVSMEYATEQGVVSALDDVSLTVEPGASVAIVGPSGSGKSTLLGILGGLELPTSGKVWIGDELITTMPEEERAALRRRELGFVFQSHNLQPFLTVSENIGMQALLAGIPDKTAYSDELLASLGVGAFAQRFPDQLSGGQRQRVAVARALVHHPSLILADEPTGSLDSINSDRVVELLLQLHIVHKITLVVVTHDRVVADRMASVVEMSDGRVAGTKGIRP